MTAPVETRYRIIEKPARIIAVDDRGIEICGARQPFGHTEYLVYCTIRLTRDLHQVIAPTREAAIKHVKLLADLFTRGEQ